MPGSSRILRPFLTQRDPRVYLEVSFFGPYNKLLCTLFPVNTKFVVCPRLEEGSRQVPGPRFLQEVLFEDKPVLILEVRMPGICSFPYNYDADVQIRRRIEDLRG